MFIIISEIIQKEKNKMKKKIIYQTQLYYTLEEEEQVKQDLKSDYPDMDDYELQDEFYRILDDYFDDLTYEIKHNTINNYKYKIYAKLGLWYGTRDAYKECNSLYDAITSCINGENDFEIYEDRYGNLRINTANHDGRSSFVIKKITDKGERTVKFIKEVYGC